MSVGGSMSGGNNSDLIALALTGDDKFKARLKQLMDLKKEAKDEWEKLRLGKDAQKVWDEAKAKEQEVKDLLAKAQLEADMILTQAKEKAADIVRGAEAKGKVIAEKAQEKADELALRAAMAADRAEKDAEVQRISTEAAKKIEAEWKTLKADMEMKLKVALAAEAEGLALKGKYQELLAKLKSVAGSVLADE